MRKRNKSTTISDAGKASILHKHGMHIKRKVGQCVSIISIKNQTKTHNFALENPAFVSRKPQNYQKYFEKKCRCPKFYTIENSSETT